MVLHLPLHPIACFLWLYNVAAISLFPAVAGLDLGRCDFPRIDGRNLTDEAGLPGLPVLVYGLGVPKLPSLPLDEVVQVSNGRNEQGQRRYVNAKVADYLKNAERMRLEEDDRISLPTIFLSDLLTGVQRKLWHGLQLPQLMDGFTARPILSMGVNNSGEDFHNHEETWLWLAKGIKAWWISDAKHISKLRKFDPCALLSAQPEQPKLRFCVQHPGDVVFFGDHAHATCNLENFVLGIGAQGPHPQICSTVAPGVTKRAAGTFGRGDPTERSWCLRWPQCIACSSSLGTSESSAVVVESGCSDASRWRRSWAYPFGSPSWSCLLGGVFLPFLSRQ